MLQDNWQLQLLSWLRPHDMRILSRILPDTWANLHSRQPIRSQALSRWNRDATINNNSKFGFAKSFNFRWIWIWILFRFSSDMFSKYLCLRLCAWCEAVTSSGDVIANFLVAVEYKNLFVTTNFEQLSTSWIFFGHTFGIPKMLP